MIRRPDKEDNIRIDAMTEAPQGQAAQVQPHREKRAHPPRHEGNGDRSARRNDGPRHEPSPKPYAKPHGENGPGSFREPAYDKKKKYSHKAAHNGPPQHSSAAKPGFAKKPKKKFRAPA
jgi:ATP-dependent RNA helicase DeaD